jgi:hypothetical protein
MDSWHARFLGLRHLPREVTAFEIEVFFQFSAEEARIIEERRRPAFGKTACSRQSATSSAEGASRLKQKPSTERVAISMATVKVGRPMQCRLIGSTTNTSATV